MKIGEVASQKGVSPQTLRVWEKLGLISPSRSTLGHRVFSQKDLLQIEKIIQTRSPEKAKK